MLRSVKRRSLLLKVLSQLRRMSTALLDLLLLHNHHLNRLQGPKARHQTSRNLKAMADQVSPQCYTVANVQDLDSHKMLRHPRLVKLRCSPASHGSMWKKFSELFGLRIPYLLSPWKALWIRSTLDSSVLGTRILTD